MEVHDKEVIHRMIYHKGYAVRLEQLLIDPDHPQGILVYVFDLDRIDDIREALDRDYLDYAASYGDLYRMTPVTSSSNRQMADLQYPRTRTHMVETNGFVVEMQIEFAHPGSPWGAGIPLADSQRSYAAYQALKCGNLEAAAQYGRVYRLDPVDVEPAAKPWRPSEQLAESQSAV